MKKALYLIIVLSVFSCGLGKKEYLVVQYVNNSKYSIKIDSYLNNNLTQEITLKNSGDTWSSIKLPDSHQDYVTIGQEEVLNADSIIIWYDDSYIFCKNDHPILNLNNYSIQMVDETNNIQTYTFTNTDFE